MTEQRLTDELARSVLGWRPAPDRYLKPDRGWVPRSKFRPLTDIRDAFRLLDQLTGDYSLAAVPGQGFTVEVRSSGWMRRKPHDRSGDSESNERHPEEVEPYSSALGKPISRGRLCSLREGMDIARNRRCGDAATRLGPGRPRNCWAEGEARLRRHSPHLLLARRRLGFQSSTAA